ncbi:hypothetical protein O6B72_07480 [Campylobacter ureolyticus]|uniref:hypothetical protein n=1 Tax=Campylobacter ureolyticus TaxID=827 RepID=UPI0022B31BE9|nr:hypothetical protein [Campylobacter ureolyticus]MCZ6156647.1 hypothetical protein [Campylobacter ureolyticus]
MAFLLLHNYTDFIQNLDAENENVRDLIFKGYVIVFHISQRYNTITILQIYKRNQPKINFKNLA